MAYHHSHWGHTPSYMPAMGPAMMSLQGHQVQAQTPSQPKAQSNGPSGQRLDSYHLTVIQQPQLAKAANGKDKDRKPVDPPPILRLTLPPDEDPDGVYRQSPYLIAVAYLEYGQDHTHGANARPPANMMSGTMVSSLHRLKDPSNQEGAFFIFGDLTIRSEGVFAIRFDLLQMEFGGDSEADSLVTITSVRSEDFRVHAGKSFPGMAESTFLTRSFSDQGVRLRLRKDSRQLANRKRNIRTAERMDRRQGQLPRQESQPSSIAAQHTNLGTQQGIMSSHHGGSQNGHMSQHMDDRFYEQESFGDEPNKRHRTTSASLTGTPATSEASVEMRSWGSYPSSQPYSGSAITAGPTTSTSMGGPLMPPPTGRIDTHFSSIHQGSSAFASPAAERQSPISHSPMHHSPIQFGSSTAHSSSPLPYIFGGSSNNPSGSTLSLAPMSSHSQTSMGTPTLQNVSPRSHHQVNGAGSTGTASPVGSSMYTTAPAPCGTPQPRQASYSNTTPYQSAYDHSTLHEHGMHTPLTGNLPPEGLNGPYSDVFNHLVPKSDQSA
ncbi:velvet factor-domain-containing protein [Xylariomycetidae sp. FL0641]|nr:velvet factor-domain-containing protein [Xylariomycetidae sp. FL0641]